MDCFKTWIAPLLMTVILTLPGLSAPLAALPETVRVLEENEGGVLLQFTLPDLSVQPAGGERVIVGAGALSIINETGAPAVPEEVVLIALPPGAEASLEWSGLQIDRSGEYRIAPVPAVDREGRTDFIIDDRYAGRLYPERWAEISRPAKLRDLRVVSLVIHPVRHDFSTGESEILRSAQIRVRFVGGTVPAAKGDRADRFDSVYRRSVVNHRSAIAWRQRSETALSKRTRQGDSFASSANWIKVGIAEHGLYSIDYDDLTEAGILDPRSSIGDARTLRMFAGPGTALEENITHARPDWMSPVAIVVDGEEDGSFDPGDRIEFYALGGSGWLGEFDPDTEDYYVHYEHPYDWNNYCWLTWGGSFEGEPLRMERVPSGTEPAGGAVTLATFTDRVHEEQDNQRDLSRWGEDGWFWDKYSETSTDKSFFIHVPDADSTAPGNAKVRFYHYEDNLNDCGMEVAVIKVNGVRADTVMWNSCTTVCDSHYVVARPNGDVDTLCGFSHIVPYDFDSTAAWVKNEWNRFDILAPTPGPENGWIESRRKFYLAWIEMGYERYLRAVDGELRIRLDEPGAYRIPVAGLRASSSRVFDVTDPHDARERTGLFSSGDSLVFFVEIGGTAGQMAVADTAWKSPVSLERITPVHMREPAKAAEYIFITHEDYRSSISPLVQHRALDYSVRVFDIDDIYNEFAWGQKDAVAARDFLAYAYHNWPEESRPLFVLLVGDATSDWKGRQSAALTTKVPTFFRIDRGGEEVNTYATDDFFAYLDPNLDSPLFEADTTAIDTIYRDWAPDIAVGRFPVNTVEEAGIVANKVVDYEADPELGRWRNRFLFLADDEIKRGGRGGYDCGFLLLHTTDTEVVSDVAPERFDREKVYMVEYPLTSAYLKPLANDAYLGWIEDGFLLSNYLGHGGVDKMADEELLVLADAKPEVMNNGRRLHVFTAYSCSIGSFDLLDKNSLAELLVKMDGGGAVASFSSDAPAFASVSKQLNISFIENLLGDDGELVPVGMAALAAKAVAGASRAGRKVNDEKYALLGDPALMLAIPELDVRFEGGETIGFTRGIADTLHGEILDKDGSVATWFGGQAEVSIWGMADTLGYTFLDSACTGSAANPTTFGTKYDLLGPTFFRGIADVTGGTFRVPFFTPLDTRIGDLGRVSAYAYDTNAGRDGAGGDDSVHVVPEPVGYVPDDDEGPEVVFSVNGAPVRDGMSFDKSSLFRIDLEDESGINIQQNDNFYTIHFVIDRGRPVNLTDLFTYDANSYQNGSLSFRFADLSDVFIQEGTHELALRATDNLNNRTELDFQITLVGSSEGLGFNTPVLNYPNPFDPDADVETEILIDLSASARVTITFLTLTGRRILEIETSTTDRGLSMAVPWDGRDKDGDPVANGVYLVKVTAESEDGSESIESIGKIAVLRGVR